MLIKAIVIIQIVHRIASYDDIQAIIKYLDSYSNLYSIGDMNILSIDQSTKKVGWAWFQNGILVSSGNDTLVPEDDLSSWIENMKLYTLEHIWNKEPVLIATEDPMSLSRVNPKICFKLCMSLSGIVMACKER